MRRPSAYLAVDETLYPYRGRIGFKQYNPSKPAKYGLLYHSLCDASVPYTYFTLPYAGKPEEMCEESLKYYITGTDEYTKYLVNGFCNYNSILGCNISMDRYFTSVTIARWALEKGFTIVGTMRLDRKGIPNGIKTMIDREEKSTFYVYAENEDIMLVSYVDKKKSGKKNIVVLTTMHNDVKVTKDVRRKPSVHTFYDYTKGGVDVVDLLSSHSTTKMKVKRWPLNALAFILDTVRSNAKCILSEVQPDKQMTTFAFTWELGKMLTLPLVQRRYENVKGLRIELIQKMQRVLGIKEANRRPVLHVANIGRCHICVQDIVGSRNYKKDREKLNNKLKSHCNMCNEIVCKVHIATICQSCAAPEQ